MDSKSAERCSNCRFWFPTALEIGQCRRRAPLPLVKIENDSRWGRAFSDGDYGVHVFAETHEYVWCGDWQAKNDKPAAVYADYLADHGHAEAADVLRRMGL